MLHPRHWDATLFEHIGRLPTTPADRWLRRLSVTADHGKLWALIGAVLALQPGKLRRAALRGLGSMAVSSVLVNAVVKRVFRRVRPELATVQVERTLRRAPHTSSFPSGHSASAAAFTTGVALESPVTGALIAPLALGVGWSRVHVGVHYPGDVVAGMAFGWGVALASQRWGRTRREQPVST
ncbi:MULTISPECIES: phosphatase PAP2 family protein [unclassified Modestobacter]|uniref:phosphatase PAP2 family protein n=1 Tax=unclassified Modestobacter TaxID=2643866 RepID=UPI0022AA9AA9|nr:MULTISPECIES: phosphatase PAP2 family protein [unclassified Modestobacter]MCZ2825543.1 phosphatase PAP2 family protein [Modestobacter sp. VKM Ac-2981]MCZ2853392.1 phosphatase PAP2 family protein [Modestobacter sp. VKM Ac-2982]